VNQQGLAGCHVPPVETLSPRLIAVRDDDLLAPVTVQIPLGTLVQIAAIVRNLCRMAADQLTEQILLKWVSIHT
jgi:hypothetical protein